jgi:4-hydroxybenzoate polyprenyltransferase
LRTDTRAYCARMKHSSLWVLMFGSLAAGTLMVFGGSAAGSDIGSLAAGYGLLIVGSSLFLGVGLAAQALVARVLARPRAEVQASTERILGHRV